MAKSTVNDHVRDWTHATGFALREVPSEVHVLLNGSVIGRGRTFAKAAMNALEKATLSDDQTQALWMAGALSFDPDLLLDAVEELWGEEDDEDEDSDDLGTEDSSDDLSLSVEPE